jgi:hypothetical protein
VPRPVPRGDSRGFHITSEPCSQQVRGARGSPSNKTPSRFRMMSSYGWHGTSVCDRAPHVTGTSPRLTHPGVRSGARQSRPVESGGLPGGVFGCWLACWLLG